MKFLIDTNVISEARKKTGNSFVKAWLKRQDPEDLAISIITVMEIDVGVQRLQRRDPSAAHVFQQWLDKQVVAGFRGRILPVDLSCVHMIASLHVPDPAPEHDAIIAGTALAHHLTVVTRNTVDFMRTGVPVVNPWEPV